MEAIPFYNSRYARIITTENAEITEKSFLNLGGLCVLCGKTLLAYKIRVPEI
jgi:hypothetical protein